jgi:hypothetical protein
MHSLQRLMKIGIYYPSGHSTLNNAIDQFLDALQKVAGDNPFIRFTIKEDHLLLQGIALDSSHFFVEEFKETLTKLAITYLEIDREITPPEVQHFIASLLAFKTKFSSTKKFIHIELNELPMSVRVSQAEYLASETPEDNEGDSSNKRPTLDSIVDSLQHRGLRQEEVDQCRQFLEMASLHSLELQDSEEPFHHNSWQDVENLLLNLVLSSDLSPDNPHNPHFRRDLGALTKLLKSFEMENAEQKPMEAINLLISLIKKNPNQDEKSKNSGKGNRSDEPNLFPVSKIKKYLKTHLVPATQLEKFYDKNRAESLSIIMQLLGMKHTLQVQVRIQLMIREMLSSQLEKDEWTIIIQGVHELLQNSELEQLRIPLTMILEALRKSRHVSSLFLLERVGQGCISVELKKLLPYLVNEILIIGSQESPKLFNELCNISLFLQPSDLFESLPILEKLEAFVESRIATNLFYSMNPNHYPLFAPLLNTTIGSLLAKRIVQGFTNKPPTGLIDALLPLLDSTSPLHRQFLHEYLINSRFSKPTKSLQSLAYQIISERLPLTSTEQRKDLQLIKTIKILPRLYGEEIHLILHNIIHRKRFLVIPEWPSHCRKTAREALATFLAHNRGRRARNG